MELSKTRQTTGLPSGSSPSQQLSSSGNELSTSTSANQGISPNQPNNTVPAAQSIIHSRILFPWEAAAVQSLHPNPPTPYKLPNSYNNPTLNKLPKLEVSPKPTAIRDAYRASNKRPIQRGKVSTKAQSSTSIKSVRSQMRQSHAATLFSSTGEMASEDTPQQNEEEKSNMRKVETVDELLQGNGLSWAENPQNAVDDNMLKASREDVGMRKRVKKTHKGGCAVTEKEKASTWALEVDIKAGANVGANTGQVEQSVKESKVEDEGPELMYQFEFEDFDHLAPTVTIDEFMKDLDSEPPFADLSVSNSEAAAAQAAAPEQTKPSTEKEEKSGAHSDLKIEGVASGETPGNVKQESTAMEEALADKEGKVAYHDENLVKSDTYTSKLYISVEKNVGEHGEGLGEGAVQSSPASVDAF